MAKRATWLATVLIVGSIATAQPAWAAPCYEQSQLEAQMAAATNQARRNAGLRALAVDPQLSQVAEVHSYWMERQNRLYHSNRLGWKVTNWVSLGENVGYGGSISTLQQMFMDSPGHRQNILDPNFTYIGVSVRPEAGRLWVTVVFESRSNPGTRLDMRSC
ncbi:MAG: CAP domain-containing protein [Actinomycetota bacterium]|nr:CAP domain-containing protein [Actinomycetota bacterium]